MGLHVCHQLQASNMWDYAAQPLLISRGGQLAYRLTPKFWNQVTAGVFLAEIAAPANSAAVFPCLVSKVPSTLQAVCGIQI
jgi:hypothetical protein